MRRILLLLLIANVANARPHVLLIVADDLGWQDVGYHGSEIQTPNIDALAKAGIQLDRFYVQPVCSPTRGALLAGKFPFHLGLQVDVIRPWDTYALPLKERLLPQYLKDGGYRTAIIGKWHMGLARAVFLPESRGFDHHYGHYLGMIDYFSHDRLGGHDWHRNGKTIRETGYTTDLFADEAVLLIGAHNPATPLFLFMAFNAPHTPLQAPEPYIQKYANIANESRRVYAAMVDCMDVAIGRVLAALEARKMRDNTLVIFCSDNGGRIRNGAHNGDLRGGKKMLYEGGIRVPALVHWPGHLEGGGINRDVFHIVDLLPTLAGLANAKVPVDLDGINMLPILRGATSSRSEIPLHIDLARAAILDGKWKLVVGAEEPDEGKSSGKTELFDLDADPNETTDLAAAHPTIVARLRARIDHYRAKSAKPLGDQSQANSTVPEGFTLPKVWRPWLDR